MILCVCVFESKAFSVNNFQYIFRSWILNPD